MDAPVVDDVSIPLGADPAAGEVAIKQLCIRVLPGWEDVQQEDLEMTKISGGISNLLVKVTPRTSGLRPVAVKVFGDKTELLVDREAEQATLIKLSGMGFGAKVLAVFDNGRVEEFLNCVTLTPDDMADPMYVPRIARKLRQLHAVDPGAHAPGLVFGTIQGWMDMVTGLSFEDDVCKAERFAQVDLVSMQTEIHETRRLCEAIQSPVVLAHNDLLSGNILIIQADDIDTSDLSQCNLEGPLQLIDFEYSCAGFRGFDWGNHFNEYAGFDCDYTKYPGPEAQALFFKHYMAVDQQDIQAGAGTLQPADLSMKELDKLSAEANLFALASHIYWGVWALIQAKYSPIEFDYLDYSAMRWREYHKRKHEFVSAAKAVFGLTS